MNEHLDIDKTKQFMSQSFFIPTEENNEMVVGAFTSTDGRRVCYVRECHTNSNIGDKDYNTVAFKALENIYLAKLKSAIENSEKLEEEACRLELAWAAEIRMNNKLEKEVERLKGALSDLYLSIIDKDFYNSHATAIKNAKQLLNL